MRPARWLISSTFILLALAAPAAAISIGSGTAVARFPVGAFGVGLVASNLAGTNFLIESMTAGLDAMSGSASVVLPGEIVTPFNVSLQPDVTTFLLDGVQHGPGSCSSVQPICGALDFRFQQSVRVPGFDVGPSFGFSSPFLFDGILSFCVPADGSLGCGAEVDLALTGQGLASITYVQSGGAWIATETEYTFATPEPATLLLLGSVLPLTVALSRRARPSHESK